MATHKEFHTRIRMKRDTSSNWTSQNPILLNGEIIIVDTDNGVRYKVGNGTSTYTQLPFTDEPMRNLVNAKQDKLTIDSTPTSGSGNPVASGGVYNYAVPKTLTINNKALSSNINLTASDVGAAAASHGNHVPDKQTANKATFLRNDNTWQKVTPANIGAASTTELSTGLATKANVEHGNHVPEVETANSAKFLRNDNTWQIVTPANIGAVPSSRTVNSKALTGNITLSASDVGAVPTARTINGHALTGDVSLTVTDIGAAAASHGNHVPATETASNKKFLRNDNTWQTVTPGNIGAVPTSRTVNGKNLSSNISLTAADVGAAATEHGNHVPATETANNKKFLRNDNTWQTVTPANIGAATPSEIDTKVSAHNTATGAHSDIRSAISSLTTKVNNFLDVDETTSDQLSEVLAMIDANEGTIESLTTSKINVSDIANNLTTNSTTKVLSAAQGVNIQTQLNSKSDAGHNHDERYYTESEVDSKLSGKANSSHGNHVPDIQTAQVATFLRNDNTWQKVTPANIGAASTTELSSGLATKANVEHGNHIPDPQTAQSATFLRNDNTWQKITASTISAVPTSRAVNGKKLSSNITLSASDVGAAATEHGNHVPETETADNTKFLRNDNTWQSVTPDNIGAAKSSHNHSASNITSGTLVVARGGTGLTASPSMLVNLGSTSAGSVFAASPRPGVTGTLPIANGGTGATTAAAALANFGLTATAAEINKLDGLTATTTELNYVDGVTSNIQTQLDGKASSSHGLSKGTDTTASSTLSFGGTFTAVTDTTVSGHTITDKTTTYTMPSDRLFTTLVPTGTAISTQGTDLQSTTYLKVGRYYCSANATAVTLKNCPTDKAFMMEVYSPLSTTIDNETTAKYVYRLRKITEYNTGIQYMQYVGSGATAGSFTYADWYVVPRAKFTLDTTDTNDGSAAIGSATKPVYIKSDGEIVACSYTLGKSVPSDAVFKYDNFVKSGSGAAAGLVPAPPTTAGTSKYLREDGTWATPTNTKNTAGATDSSKKLFLIGAESQEANPPTYSHNTAYVDTDGCLYSGGVKVLTAHPSIATGSGTSNQTTSHGGTFKAIGSLTVDGNGHVTDYSVKTYTLPKYSNATTSAAGLMSAADKGKLDGMGYTYGTTDLVAGSSSLATGMLYFVYE